MSNSSKHAKASVTFHPFGGIGAHAAHQDPCAAADTVNFRIRSDGSLEKRCGYRLLADVSSPIRASLSGRENGRSVLYLLAENTVFRLDLESGTLHTLGTVARAGGEACFFFLEGTLYLSDSLFFYSLASGSPVPVVGYVPLVGKDWRNNEVGEPWEPRNLLNRHARISYRIGDPASIFLCTKDPVESVEAVYVNGQLADPDRYSIDDSFCTVNVKDLQTGDRVLVCLTYKSGNDALLSDLCTVTDSVLFGTAENSRLFFWGGQRPCTVFCSAHVSRDALAESRLHYPESDGLYIPDGFEFQVGEGRSPVQGALCHHDRLLLFTEKDAWAARSDVSGLSEFPTVCIHAAADTACFGGAVLAGNTPVTLGRHTVWQWEEESGEKDRYRAERLSAAVEPLFGTEELARSGIFYHPIQDEIWIYHKQNGTVWVCRPSVPCWYRFTDLYADRFFEADGSVGFLKLGKIYLTDTTLKRDLNGERDAGEPINALYCSGISDLGSDRKKNAAALTVDGDLDGGTLTFTLYADGRQSAQRTLQAEEGSAHGVFRLRLPSGRFTCASLTVEATGDARPVLHRLTLHQR